MPFAHVTGPLFALLAVLALILCVGRLGRVLRARLDRAGRTSVGRLGVGPAIAIDAGRRLVVLSCDGREFAVLLGPGGDTTLCELSNSTAPRSGAR